MDAPIARGGIVTEGMGLATALLDGLKPGCRPAGRIIVCDLTGTCVRDTAMAIHAVRVAAVWSEQGPAPAAGGTSERS